MLCLKKERKSWETYHSSGGVDDLHLFEDSGTIIGDQNFTLGCLDLSIGKKTKVSMLNTKS